MGKRPYYAPVVKPVSSLHNLSSSTLQRSGSSLARSDVSRNNGTQRNTNISHNLSSNSFQRSGGSLQRSDVNSNSGTQRKSIAPTAYGFSKESISSMLGKPGFKSEILGSFNKKPEKSPRIFLPGTITKGSVIGNFSR